MKKTDRMKRLRLSEEQIMAILKQQRSGMAVADDQGDQSQLSI